jgi:Transposase family tnp2
MKVKTIHACPNEYILYRNEYSDLDKCPKCEVSRYKTTDGQINNSKRPAMKVLWYFPVVPRFQRLLEIPEMLKLLWWHADCRKKNGMLRHTADSPKWRKIDKTFPDFGAEPRNLRLGLCTDVMNLYGNMNSRYSTWPVLLCIYNLPP